ncbi:MAG: T9SS type A sorting domain-containing protein [Chitinophagaceae bacterium]|nr:T9SS type A sorting domain-containing protein [Chitinophagaceae bacterium]
MQEKLFLVVKRLSVFILFTGIVISVNAQFSEYFEGKDYYHLPQVNMPGKISYSEPRYVNITRPALSINVYPNPVKGNSFSISIAEKIGSPLKYTLVNTDGKIIQQGYIAQTLQKVQVNYLVKGTYFFQVANEKPIVIVKE